MPKRAPHEEIKSLTTFCFKNIIFGTPRIKQFCFCLASNVHCTDLMYFPDSVEVFVD